MVLMVLSLVLSADPRYLGGADATPLTKPGPVNTNPTLEACTVETLRISGRCIFDSHPAQVEKDAERKKQSKVNVELAAGLVRDLCARRVPEDLEPKERSKRIDACVQVATPSAATCSLNGVEALLDDEGRFSTHARACYENLASAMQSVDVPGPESQRNEAPKPEPRRQPIKL
jgi:hypothetical protein